MVLPGKHLPEESFYHSVFSQDIVGAEPIMGMLSRYFMKVPPSGEMESLCTAPLWSLLCINLFYFITYKNHLQVSECHWCSCQPGIMFLLSSTTSEQHLEVTMTSLHLTKVPPSHDEHIQYGCLVTLNTLPQQWNSQKSWPQPYQKEGLQKRQVLHWKLLQVFVCME